MYIRKGFLITDEQDWVDKLLIRVLGFTIVGIHGGWTYGYVGIQLLGFWFEVNF